MRKVVIAYDPSLTAFAQAVLVEETRSVETACIQTKKAGKAAHLYVADDDFQRAEKIFRPLEESINEAQRRYEVTLVSEQPAGSQSSKAAKALGISWGLVVGLRQRVKGPFYSLTKLQIAEALCGKKNVSKEEQAVAAVQYLGELGYKTDYPAKGEDSNPRREGRGDALAVLAAAVRLGLVQL